jgi:hypothetical protein
MGEDWVEILDPSEKKPHSRLGIASCVAFLLSVLIILFNYSERFSPYPCGNTWPNSPCDREQFRIWDRAVDIENGLRYGLLIIGGLMGLISLRDKSKNKLVGYIGVAANILVPVIIIVTGLIQFLTTPW